MATKSHKKHSSTANPSLNPKPLSSSTANPSLNPKPLSSDQKRIPLSSDQKRMEQHHSEAEKAKKQKPSNEIDEIFQPIKSAKKREPQEEARAKKPKARGEEVGKKKRKGKKNEEPDDEDGGAKRPRRRTTDGLPIYSFQELGFGNPDAGGTPDCPFDCECCF